MIDRFLNPHAVVASLPFGDLGRVVDLGAGHGHFTYPLAERAREVVALDINPRMLRSIKRNDRSNIRVLEGDASRDYGLPLQNRIADHVLLSNTLFQVEKKDACAREIHRILKPHGCAIIIDWEDSFGGIGPHREHVVPRRYAERLFESEGFSIEQELPETGMYHYGFIARKY